MAPKSDNDDEKGERGRARQSRHCQRTAPAWSSICSESARSHLTRALRCVCVADPLASRITPARTVSTRLPRCPHTLRHHSHVRLHVNLFAKILLKPRRTAVYISTTAPPFFFIFFIFLHLSLVDLQILSIFFLLFCLFIQSITLRENKSC